MVPDCFGAQVQFSGDLFGRAALFEKSKHIDLRGVRCGGGAVGLWSRCSSISPKTPTTRSPFLSGTALISTASRVPSVETRTPVASVAGAVPSTFRGTTPGATAVLRGDDGGVLATTNVPKKPLGCGIDPADDPRSVEDVAGDADAGQSLLDIAAD